MTAIRLGLPPLAILALSGCATYVEGGPASDSAMGIEYSLPVPVIRVTPQANGTMAVDVDYLPDPNNTYMLRTRSTVSSYTLDVQRENGLLKSVSLDSHADAVAAAAVESAGNIVKARSDQLAKEQETATAAAKEQAKALSDAQLAVNTEEAKLTTLVDAQNAAETAEAKAALADKILEAKLAKAEATAKLDFLKSQAAVAGGSTFNAVVNSSLVAAGPVLFRVVPVGPDSVKLVAFDGPSLFATSLAAKPAEEAPADLAARIDGSGVFQWKANQPVQFNLIVNRAVRGLDRDRTKLFLTGGGATNRKDLIVAANANPIAGGTNIIVTLKANAPTGSYRLEPVLTTADGQPAAVDPVDFTIRR